VLARAVSPRPEAVAQEGERCRDGDSEGLGGQRPQPDAEAQEVGQGDVDDGGEPSDRAELHQFGDEVLDLLPHAPDLHQPKATGADGVRRRPLPT